MNLCPDDSMPEDKAFPLGIGSRRIGKQNERLLYLGNLGRRLRDRKAEPVLLGRARADIPELGDILRREVNRLAAFKKQRNALDREGVALVVRLGAAQENVCIDENAQASRARRR